MQGAIFTSFSDMIIEKMGMSAWNEILERTAPESGGMYTSGGQYNDSELINMIVYLSEKTGISVSSLLEEFGKYLFSVLYASSPEEVLKIDNLRDFLLSIDQVIHVEVKRMHPNAYLPKFEYEDGSDGALTMFYKSKRKLCHACVGLIYGAAQRFNQEVSVAHSECMHSGYDRCKLIITFRD